MTCPSKNVWRYVVSGRDKTQINQTTGTKNQTIIGTNANAGIEKVFKPYKKGSLYFKLKVNSLSSIKGKFESFPS